MKYLYLFVATCLFVSCVSIQADVTTTETKQESISDKNEAEAGIRLVMKEQEAAWNRHDLEGFMAGYWKSDELKFYSTSGLTKGWDQTLANYKKGYPTKAESGILNFTINDISEIENNSYFVLGEYFLSRAVGDANGSFIIIFKKINGEWKIIADMTASA